LQVSRERDYVKPATDPVRAKAEARQPAGMDTETATLFPDSFERSTLGEIPTGWHVLKLGDVAR
jgi:type I restriction enzyme, S subunit